MPTDDVVSRTEYERMRSLADDQHAKFMVAAAENEHLRTENAVMREVLTDLEMTTRLGGLGASTFDVGFVWSQNQEALLSGETTWESQFGPHRERRSLDKGYG